jgi:hypothetical protein
VFATAYKTRQVIISVHSLSDKRAFSALIWALKATCHALSMCPLASSLERRLSPLWLLKCAVSSTTCLEFSWKFQQLLIYPPSFQSSSKDSMSQIGVHSSVPYTSVSQNRSLVPKSAFILSRIDEGLKNELLTCGHTNKKTRLSSSPRTLAQRLESNLQVYQYKLPWGTF